MENYTLVRDIAVLLLAAGISGLIFKRLGLSVIVGYLIAGIVIGPNTPVKMIVDEHRIEELSQIGLAFVMFSVGLHLSVTKLRKMGWATLMATGLGAFFMLQFTLLLGSIAHWSNMQSLFVAAMLMVSSSAVISKIMEEMHLTHNRTAQMALAMTIVEDIVAILMLTLLSTKVGSQTESAGALEQAGSFGLSSIIVGAFIVMLLISGLLLIPRVLHRVDTAGDSELRTIVIAGLLLFISFCAVKANYSIALGAFLFGAIIAELPEKLSIEKSFDSVRSIFSSIFFVSIGMMIKPEQLSDSWSIAVALSLFSLFVRPLACGFALILVGVTPREAKRGGMLLAPLGEFTFIIATVGISSQFLDQSFYPIAVALSIFTVLATPILNRFSEQILNFSEKIEPRWLTRLIIAYQDWLKQFTEKKPSGTTWKLIRPQFITVAINMFFVTGILVFSQPFFKAITQIINEGQLAGDNLRWIGSATFTYVFWALIGLCILPSLIVILRNVSVIAQAIAENATSRQVSQRIFSQGIKTIAFIMFFYWLYAILPISAFSFWGWIIIGILTIAVLILFSRRLISWHSSMSHSVSEVFSQSSIPEEQEKAREEINRGLESWELLIQECIIPPNPAYLGKNLSELAIPSKFGSTIIEIERNGQSIFTPGPKTMLFPGDKILLLGKSTQIAEAKTFLQSGSKQKHLNDSFYNTVLECARVDNSPRSGKTFTELNIARETGVRIVGIQRGEERIINPTGKEKILEGDDLLILGTMDNIKRFNKWLLETSGKGNQPSA